MHVYQRLIRVLLFTLLLTSCSGDDEKGQNPPPPAPAPTPAPNPVNEAKQQIDEATARVEAGLQPAEGDSAEERERKRQRLAEVRAARDRAKRFLDDHGRRSGIDQARLRELIRKAHETWLKERSLGCSIAIEVRNSAGNPIRDPGGSPSKVVEGTLQSLASPPSPRNLRVRLTATCGSGSPTITKHIESSKAGPTDANATWTPDPAAITEDQTGAIDVPGGSISANVIVITAKCVCDADTECETATVIFLV